MKTGLAIISALIFCLAGMAQNTEDDNRGSDELIGRAVALMDNGAVGTAISVLNGVLEKEPDNMVARYELGYAHYINDNMPRAIEELSKIVDKWSYNEQVYCMLGNSYDMNGQPDKAEEVYKKGLGKFPKSASLLNELSVIALKADDYNKSLDYCLQGIKANPTYSPCYFRAAYRLAYKANEGMDSVRSSEAERKLSEYTAGKPLLQFNQLKIVQFVRHLM